MDETRRRILQASVLLTGLSVGASTLAQTPPPDLDTAHRRNVANWPAPSQTIDLWPKGAPGAPAVLPVEHTEETFPDGATHFRHVSGIAVPRLAAFPAAKPNGAAVLIIPGGGYSSNYYDHEGYMVADFLNQLGVSAFVLFYRLPGEGWANRSDVPLADAQRAMRLIRASAQHFSLDPARLAALGFSAGGHLCASLLTRYDATVYAPADSADTQSAKPFLAAPIYPVQSMDASVAHMGSRDNLLGPNPTPEQITLYSPDQNITTSTPPCFLAHAEDDNVVPVANTLRLRAALRAASVVCETHLFAEGGHGFGMTGAEGKPAHEWPNLFARFAQSRGLWT